MWTILWMKFVLAEIFKVFQRCLADAMEALWQHVHQEPATRVASASSFSSGQDFRCDSGNAMGVARGA
jgi:hypothetical protein